MTLYNAFWLCHSQGSWTTANGVRYIILEGDIKQKIQTDHNNSSDTKNKHIKIKNRTNENKSIIF